MQLIYRSRNSFTKVLLQTHLLHELDNIIKYHATSLKCNTMQLSTSKAHNHQPPLEAHSLIICHTSISLKRWQCMICLKPAPLFGNTQHPPPFSQHVAQLREKRCLRHKPKPGLLNPLTTPIHLHRLGRSTNATRILLYIKSGAASSMREKMKLVN